MPPPEVILPSGFTDKPFDRKLKFVDKANKSKPHLDRLIEWLKDPERPHNQKEDDMIILFLFQKIDYLIKEGIILPPPMFGCSLINSDDFDKYLNIYVKVPHREATEEEKKEIVGYIYKNKSAYYNDFINVLLKYDFLPQLTFEKNPACNILFNFGFISEKTIQQIIDVGFERGDFWSIGIDLVSDFLKARHAFWTKHEKEINNEFFSLNKKKYDFAISYFNNKKKELIKQSKNIYSEIETSKPNTSYLGRLPMNLTNTIVEYTTGLKHSQYGGTRFSKQKQKTRKILHRKRKSVSYR